MRKSNQSAESRRSTAATSTLGRELVLRYSRTSPSCVMRTPATCQLRHDVLDELQCRLAVEQYVRGWQLRRFPTKESLH